MRHYCTNIETSDKWKIKDQAAPEVWMWFHVHQILIDRSIMNC